MLWKLFPQSNNLVFNAPSPPQLSLDIEHLQVSTAVDFMRTKSAFNQELLSRYNLWLVAQQYIYKTQQIYMRVLSNFCKFLGHQSIMEATHFDIRAFLAHESRRGIAF